jgi:predicted transposase YbfD/YdcC
LAVDGKTSVGAVPRGMDKSETHIVNAVCGPITVGMEPVREKSNEIVAIPILLDRLNSYDLVKGKVVTSDAMGCQRLIAEKILAFGGDYLLALKDNHPTLYNQVVTLFKDGLTQYPGKYCLKTVTTEVELVGGRVEHREMSLIELDFNSREWVAKEKDWPGMRTVMMVRRIVDGPNQQVETRYFISSVSLPVEEMLDMTIRHWSVETMQFRSDKSFDEDQSKIYKGNAPVVMSFFRKLALNFIVPISLRHQGVSTRTVSMACDQRWDYLMEVLNKRPRLVESPIDFAKKLPKTALKNIGPYPSLRAAKAKPMPRQSQSKPF